MSSASTSKVLNLKRQILEIFLDPVYSAMDEPHSNSVKFDMMVRRPCTVMYFPVYLYNKLLSAEVAKCLFLEILNNITFTLIL